MEAGLGGTTSWPGSTLISLFGRAPGPEDSSIQIEGGPPYTIMVGGRPLPGIVSAEVAYEANHYPIVTLRLSPGSITTDIEDWQLKLLLDRLTSEDREKLRQFL